MAPQNRFQHQKKKEKSLTSQAFAARSLRTVITIDDDEEAETGNGRAASMEREVIEIQDEEDVEMAEIESGPSSSGPNFNPAGGCD